VYEACAAPFFANFRCAWRLIRGFSKKNGAHERRTADFGDVHRNMAAEQRFLTKKRRGWTSIRDFSQKNDGHEHRATDFGKKWLRMTFLHRFLPFTRVFEVSSTSSWKNLSLIEG
jgi:hypothetical protein